MCRINHARANWFNELLIVLLGMRNAYKKVFNHPDLVNASVVCFRNDQVRLPYLGPHPIISSKDKIIDIFVNSFTRQTYKPAYSKNQEVIGT